MVQQYGAEASALAALRAAEHYARGEALKMAAWQRVLEAIVCWTRISPPRAKSVH
jgi:hypothetical protein